MKMKGLIAVLCVILAALCVWLVVIIVQENVPTETTGDNLNIVDGTVDNMDWEQTHDPEFTLPEQTGEDATEPQQTTKPQVTEPTDGEGDLFDDDENDGEDGNGPTVGVDAPENPTRPTDPSEGTEETTEPTKPTEGEGDSEAGSDPTEETADFVIDFDDLLNNRKP